MNPSTPRCGSDGSQSLKLSAYNSIQHSQQPSSNSQSLGQSLTLQPLEPSQGLTGSTLVGASLHEMLAFGMDYYSPHMNAQTLQGLQESLSHLRSDTIKGPSPVADVSSQALSTALMLLQQKILHLQSLVQLMAQGDKSNAAVMQQQMATAVGVATVISQLVTAAAGLLPQVHQQSQPAVTEQRSPFAAASSPDLTLFQHNGSGNDHVTSLGMVKSNSWLDSSTGSAGKSSSSFRAGLDGSPDLGSHVFGTHSRVSTSNTLPNTIENALGNSLLGSFATGSGSGVVRTIDPREGNRAVCVGNPFIANISMELNSFLEDQNPGEGFKDDEDDGETENLPPGSYELIELDAMEILAEHTHFCEICGKGFKRDANLRMHMRGHGDEYKTVAALSKPEKSIQEASLRKPRRYSCPYLGCKRNKMHKKFLPLKTMLCVKNHYRRSHCPKMLTCTKCKIKKFSVAADLKTHEKHCGRDKWQCSCGNTFSRKDKLLGHLGLFVGHTSASPLHEADLVGNGGSMERGGSSDANQILVSESFGARDGSKVGSEYSLGLSGTKSDGVSGFAIGELNGSSVMLGGDEFRRCLFTST